MKTVINRVTGIEMQVADDRVDDYVARGHRVKPAPKKAAPKKATAKKAPKEKE